MQSGYSFGHLITLLTRNKHFCTIFFNFLPISNLSLFPLILKESTPSWRPLQPSIRIFGSQSQLAASELSEVEALMTNELGGRRRAGLPGCNFQFSVTLVTFLVTAHTPTKDCISKSKVFISTCTCTCGCSLHSDHLHTTFITYLCDSDAVILKLLMRPDLLCVPPTLCVVTSGHLDTAETVWSR